MWMREGQLLHSGSLTKREAAFTAIILAGEPEEMCEGSPESWEKSLKTWFHASRQRKALMVYKFPLRTQLSYLESFTGSKIGSSSLQTADRGPNVAKQTVLYTFCWNIVKPENPKSHKKQINVSLINKNLQSINLIWEERGRQEENGLWVSGCVVEWPPQSLHHIGASITTQDSRSPRTNNGIMLIKGLSCEKLTWHHYIREFGPKR